MAKLDESDAPAAGAIGGSVGEVLADAMRAAVAGLSAGPDAPVAAPERRRTPPRRPLGGRRKRVADVTIAVTALVLSLPVMMLAALLILATNGGPVLYSHERVGYLGRPFRCLKFRTMAKDGDRILAEHLARDPEAAKQWSETRKLARDPRVTRLGMVLRKTSIDELPQFVNILRGEMSCVGPRPVVADELALYGPAAGDYLRSRPGLTGLWQVTGRSSTDYPTRVSLDSQYVRTWSHRADLAILARTVFAVMRFQQVS